MAGLPWLAASPALAAVPALTTKRSSSCSWDRPGHNPFVGDLVASIDRYTDIPQATRERLKQRMAVRDYDDLVSIKRDSISGKKSYDPRIREMHFGENSMCREVTRTKWTPQMEERGLVYCEAGHCILVPTVCRNVSRIQRADAGRGNVAGADLSPLAAGGEPQPTVLATDPDSAGSGAATDVAALPLSQVASTWVEAAEPGGVGGAVATPAGGVGPGPVDAFGPAPLPTPGLGDLPWDDLGRVPGAVASGLPTPAAPVPEPAAAWLWLGGLALLVTLRRRFGPV